MKDSPKEASNTKTLGKSIDEKETCKSAEYEVAEDYCDEGQGSALKATLFF
jgi:hypothetical protein